MELNLVVIRTANTKRLADFYSLFGLKFHYHNHGNGPFHYSAPVGESYLEIYPLLKDQTEVDKGLRLGFSLSNFDDQMKLLKENKISFSMEPVQTEFGFMAVVLDPDGRKIELYRK